MNKDFIYEEQKQLIEMWKNKYYEQKEKVEQLENNRDKAIEYLHQGKFRFWEMENILKGDSDE